MGRRQCFRFALLLISMLYVLIGFTVDAFSIGLQSCLLFINFCRGFSNASPALFTMLGAGLSASELTEGLEGAEAEAMKLPDSEVPTSASMLGTAAGGSRLRDGPRLLGLHPGRVVMFVPGMGVRPFPFSRVLGGDAPQVGQQALLGRAPPASQDQRKKE